MQRARAIDLGLLRYRSCQLAGLPARQIEGAQALRDVPAARNKPVAM
jgi:hypothetical protein